MSTGRSTLMDLNVERHKTASPHDRNWPCPHLQASGKAEVDLHSAHFVHNSLIPHQLPFHNKEHCYCTERRDTAQPWEGCHSWREAML